MPYSIIVNGKVLDYHYKKLSAFSYNFYIGNMYMGQVFNMGKSWSCVAKEPNKLCPIDGFKTRFDACEMILKLNGYRNQRSTI